LFFVRILQPIVYVIVMGQIANYPNQNQIYWWAFILNDTKLDFYKHVNGGFKENTFKNFATINVDMRRKLNEWRQFMVWPSILIYDNKNMH